MAQTSLKGKIGIVTGGSSGIGKAIVENMLINDALVVNADVNASDVFYNDETNRKSKNYFFHKTDITVGEEVQQLYSYVTANVGLPQILVCNAGVGIHEKLSEGDPEKWFQVINTNLMGTLRVLRSFLPELSKHECADIVFVSSVSAHQAYEYGGIYGATKAAINMIAETLRLELKEKARVTVIEPGVVDTSFFKNRISGQTDVQSIGVNALASSEVADAVHFALTRPTGQVLNNIVLRPVNQLF